jgi:hypothetical protein
MAIRTLPVNLLFRYNFSDWSYTLDLFRLSPDSSYISIFGPDQFKQLEIFLKSDKVKLLFKGNKAVNGSRHHGTIPRNTIVVFELA